MKGMNLKSALAGCAAVALMLGVASAQATGPAVKSATGATKPQPQPELPRMEFLGKFSAGVPGAGIYKLLDRTDGVVCYVLMPDAHQTTQTPAGVVYNSNNLGSISCIKVRYGN